MTELDKPLALGTLSKAQLVAVALLLGLEPTINATKASLIRAITAKRRSVTQERTKGERP